MKIYLVGGAVRDELLGLPVTERDWVVVGATEEDMLAQGFRKIGKDFPVFLHPQTKEEYALARKERKVGAGYHGFDFEANLTISLEDDLIRRDLTLNAMAKTETGEIIDPHGGQSDCQKRLLRHVSPAFVEDPVRVLRVARFAARFHPLGFKVAPETLALMRHMGQSGELDHLVSERVFKEMQQALKEPAPFIFFQVLHDCGALLLLFPELEKHFTVDFSLKALKSNDPMLRFTLAVSCLDFKELTTFFARLPIPKDYQSLAKLVVLHVEDFVSAERFNAEKYLHFLEQTDAFRRSERFDVFLTICEARFATRFPEKIPPTAKLKHALALAKQVNMQPLVQSGMQGEGLKKAIHAARQEAIAAMRID